MLLQPAGVVSGCCQAAFMTVDLWCGRVGFHWLDEGSDRGRSADGKEMGAGLNLELF